MSKKTIKGKVISMNMKDTIVVKVEEVKIHKRYKKRYKVSKNYFAHYTGQKIKVGDFVTLVESKPISKNKFWKILEDKK